MKEFNQSEERKGLHEAWFSFEMTHGDENSQSEIRKKAPKLVKKKRQQPSNEGAAMEWEEYWEYVFPDEITKAPNLKLLEMAKRWKKGNEEAINRTETTLSDITDPHKIPLDDSDSDIEM